MGVLLYEMATGSRPFGGETSADLISSILRDTPDSVTELKIELPHHLGRIVRHCLEKDPNRRYQSALDIRNELEDLRQEIASGTIHSETAVLPATAHSSTERPAEVGSRKRYRPGSAGRSSGWLVLPQLKASDSATVLHRERPPPWRRPSPRLRFSTSTTSRGIRSSTGCAAV